jgi:hypothetical protein
MRKVSRLVVSLFVVSALISTFCPSVRAEQDPTTDQWNMLDLFIARPMGVAAGIVGTAFFVAALPFTIPTRSVDKSAKMLIKEPFKFSFKRSFPDPHIQSDESNY